MGFLIAILLNSGLAWSQYLPARYVAPGAYGTTNIVYQNQGYNYGYQTQAYGYQNHGYQNYAQSGSLPPSYLAPSTNSNYILPVRNYGNFSGYTQPREIYAPGTRYAPMRYAPIPRYAPEPSFNLGNLFAMLGSLFSSGLSAPQPAPVAPVYSPEAPEHVPYCARCSLHSEPLTPLPEEAAPVVTHRRVKVQETEAGLPSRYVAPSANAGEEPSDVRNASSGGDRVATTGDGDRVGHPRTQERPRVRPISAPERAERPHAEHARTERPRPERHRVSEPYTPRERRQVRALDRDERRALTAPIWASFNQNFQACAPGCEPVGYAAYGDRGNLSCHPTGRALDVHGMTCNGRTIQAIGDSPEWNQMLACMRTKMTVLYHNKPWNGGANKTLGHYDHAHFSNGCIVNGHHVW